MTLRSRSSSALLVFLTAAASLLACSSEGDPASGAALPIVGGTLDTDHDAVVTVFSSIGRCSGTLIQANADGTGLVLTAAHCVAGAVGPFIFIIGDDISGGDAVGGEVVSAHVHPGYGGIATGHDIAVLRVTGVPVGAAILEPLTPDEDHLGPGSDYLVIGFGTRDAAGTLETTRRHSARLRVHSVTFNRILSVWGDGTTCRGDSGGALVRVVGGRERLVGVHVTGAASCDMTQTSGAERVAFYADFIASVAEDRAPGCTTCVIANEVSCFPAHIECGSDEDCFVYRSCLNACLDLDVPCANACIASNTAGAALYATTVGACLCGAPCADTCTAECTGSLAGIAIELPDAGMPDAGMPDPPDSGVLPDAGVGADAATSDDGGAPAVSPSPTSGGCNCRATGEHRSNGTTPILFALTLLFVARRRRH
jgi:MYXO-CTERM domain-containing protein